MNATSRMSAVVLAAGLSRRMGSSNKLLMPYRGVPLVRHVVATVASLPFVEVVVATGHEADDVESALEGLQIRIARNDRYEEGQMTTVRAALSALTVPSYGVMVCLGDQPMLAREDLASVADAFLQSPLEILVPTFRGARGNPIVLPGASLQAILARGGNFGCRQFVEKNADLVRTFEMPNDHVLVDLDRPEDWARLNADAR